jgi:hypothetical protein
MRPPESPRHRRAASAALADAGFDIALVDLLEAEMAVTARRTQCCQTQRRQWYR